MNRDSFGAEQIRYLLSAALPEEQNELYATSQAIRRQSYSNGVYIRGLIELTNYCSRRCIYCGINASNRIVKRYRLTKEAVLATCEAGYSVGFRTFVLQGGEDPLMTDDFLIKLISEVKHRCPDAAVTLSLGERSEESYRRLFDAGADRYLLRHETADPDLYKRFHPGTQLEQRIEALNRLHSIGYQVGSGFLIGLPDQTVDTIVRDIELLKQIEPQMIGVGPFIPHHQTILGSHPAGSVDLTLRVIAILRILFPNALIPATTALATLSNDARLNALVFGANVVMPNLTPADLRQHYSLYDGKKCHETEAAESLSALKTELLQYGLVADMGRGDHPMF